MSAGNKPNLASDAGLLKAPTGIAGLDEITRGGLPAGRSTLVCGGPGCGKTVLAMEFLVRGASEQREPGLFVSFEESKEDLFGNFRSFGFDVPQLVQDEQLGIVHFALSRGDMVEAGEFSLDGLFIRLQSAIDTIGARRIAIDTLESLFSSLSNTSILRAELARIFRWLKDKGLTAVITAERGDGALTRNGLEEYVSDCVLLLDHRVADNVSKRRLRVVKYRGSAHSADEFPFLVDSRGISVLPLSSVRLAHEVSSARVHTGVADLDEMLEGNGYFRGSTVLVSGSAGCGKSTLAAAFAQSACESGERCLYFSFEESPAQLVRNMRSVGIDLGPAIERGALIVHSSRPTLCGLEEHLVAMTRQIEEQRPAAVVMDPITDFLSIGNRDEVRSMLTRIFDVLRSKQATVVATHLIHGTGDQPETVISSLMDTWIDLRTDRVDLAHPRQIQIIKSRGMDHARDTRALILSKSGLSVRSLTLPTADQRTGPPATGTR